MTGEIVIVVRGGPAAKTRCRAALGGLRDRLIAAMLEDMIAAIARLPTVTRTTLVTPTLSLAEIARARGLNCILETEAAGMNQAFDRGRRAIAMRDPTTPVALLPGDLPLLESCDLDRAFALHQAGGVVIVPSAADGGTGGIVLAAGQSFSFAYGRGSFERHVAAARDHGLTPRPLVARSLGIDIDCPDNFPDVLASRLAHHTRALLSDLALVRDHAA